MRSQCCRSFFARSVSTSALMVAGVLWLLPLCLLAEQAPVAPPTAPGSPQATAGAAQPAAPAAESAAPAAQPALAAPQPASPAPQPSVGAAQPGGAPKEGPAEKTPAEKAADAAQRIMRDFAPTANEEVRLSHILAASEDEAKELKKQVTADGGDEKAFAKTARRKSKDVTTRPVGGDLGWISMSSGMDRAFMDAAFRLKPGEVSEPVKSSFGWHLILVTSRREKERPKPPPQPETPPAGIEKPAPTVGPGDLAPRTTPGAQPPATPPAPPTPRTEPKRLPVAREPSFRVTLMSLKALRSEPFQSSYLPEQAVEIQVSVTNEGTKEESFVARELLPLGLVVTALGEAVALEGDYSKVPEPASYIVKVKPYEVLGQLLNVDDYFKLSSARRYRVEWDIRTLITKAEARFPKIKEAPEYAMVTDALKKPQAVTPDVIVRDASPRLMRKRDLPVSIFENFKPERKYYAQIQLFGENTPVTIALDFKAQFMAARYFASLVLEGFYDNLDFFDVTQGDFVLGGCPLKTGTGAPSGRLQLLRNTAKLEHKKGTVSLVSRSVRQKGPVEGGQVGSIFVVCLKDHAEWDELHVPFGQVVAGMEVLEKLSRPTAFRQVTILTEDQYSSAPATPSTSPAAAGNPEAIIKTSKGNITVELFEDVARNTAVNFVRLALDGFYGKDSKGDGKQKVILLMKDDKGQPLLVQTGSPTNDFDGNPGYFIRSEKNTTKKCTRGALVMAAQVDPTTQRYVPDTSGSQFFICLKDIGPYDYEPALTVFGQVTAGLEVLDKLAEGDTLDGVEITKKKGHSYTVQKLPAQ